MKVGDYVIWTARYHGESEGEYEMVITDIREDSLGRKRFDHAYRNGLGGEHGVLSGLFRAA